MRVAFGNHSLLKKAGENFFLSANWVPRGRKSVPAPNQYVNWVQAQPAVNRVQAQPARLTRTIAAQLAQALEQLLLSSVTSVHADRYGDGGHPSEGIF